MNEFFLTQKILNSSLFAGSSMSCIGECWDLGPPPDQILFLPPPPAPAFHQIRNFLQDNVTSPCAAAQLCDLAVGHAHAPGSVGHAPAGLPVDSADYVDMSHHEVESTNWTGGDTWLLVIAASSIGVGVLLLGSLLALFLLKCREEHRQQTKHLEQRQVCWFIGSTLIIIIQVLYL